MKLKFKICYLLIIVYSTLSTIKSHAQWVNGQAASAVIGQPDFVSSGIATTNINLRFPNGVTYDATHKKLYVFDYGNRRILRFAVPNGGFNMNQPIAEAVIGQPDMVSANPIAPPNANSLNLVSSGSVDESKDILWVADRYNNRVLGYYNASTKQNGDPANVVLGQPNFTSMDTGRTANTLDQPISVTVDDITHDIYVADMINNRILRFKANNQQNGASADLVIGQPNFITYSVGVSQNTFFSCKYVYFKNNSLFVIDASGSGSVSRVLRFDNVRNIINNQPNANIVFGYKDFITSGVNPIDASSFVFIDFKGILYSPALTVDDLGQLYVSDNGNNRVLIFPNAYTNQNGASSINVLGQKDFISNGANTTDRTFNTPAGVSIDNQNKTLYVVDYANSRVLQFQQKPQCLNSSITISTPSTALCQGTLATFTAIPVNGGNNPIYQWKINGNNVGNNSPTFSSANLTNGDQVSCVLTSNAQPCVQNNPVTSNIITVTVNPAPDINLGPDGTRLIGDALSANELNKAADVNVNPGKYIFIWNNPPKNDNIIGKIGAQTIQLNAVPLQNTCLATSSVNIVGYCKSKGTTKDMSNNVNYIDRVTVDVLDANNVAQNLINNLSGDNGGFLDYTKKAIIPLAKFKTNIITVYPYTKTASGTYVVYATAWIDYDHNGIFESMDALGLNEQVTLTYSKIGLRVAPTVSIYNYKVPFGAYNGTTRMRIAMKTTNDLYPCDNGINPLNGLTNNFLGEVEDYTVDIQGNAIYFPIYSSTREKENGSLNNSATKVTVSPNPFTQKTTLTLNNIQPNKKYTLVITDIYGRRVRQINNITTSTIEINRENLTTGIYEYQLLDGANILNTGKMVME